MPKRPERFDNLQQHHRRYNGDEKEGAVTAPKRAHAMRFTRTCLPSLSVHMLVVADHRLRRRYNACTGKLRSPRELELVRHDVALTVSGMVCRTKTTERPPQISADKDRPACGNENFADSVVLALVQFAPLHQRMDHSDTVCAKPERQQAVRYLAHKGLGAREAGVAPISLFEEKTHRVGLQDDIVVTYEHMCHSVDFGHADVGRVRVPAAGVDTRHVSVWQHARHLRSYRRRVLRDNQDRELLVVLSGQRPGTFNERRPRTTGHDHRDNGRRRNPLSTHQGS